MKPALIALACVQLLACESATDNDANARDVRGVWSYSGVQSSPSLSIRGFLRIDQQNGNEFSGTAEFSETDVQGTVRNRTGQLSGRVLGADAVDFDIFIDEASRRHVARVVADSMNGTWARTGGNPPITGSFTARKTQ